MLVTTFFATSQVFAAVKRAVSRHDTAGIWVAFFSRCQRYRCRQASLRCFRDSRLACISFGCWAFVSFNAGLWGTGVNVFFNESWDHDAHIELSYYYFVAAGFNNVFLYFAMLPRIWAEHGAPLVRYDAGLLLASGLHSWKECQQSSRGQARPTAATPCRRYEILTEI